MDFNQLERGRQTLVLSHKHYVMEGTLLEKCSGSLIQLQSPLTGFIVALELPHVKDCLQIDRHPWWLAKQNRGGRSVYMRRLTDTLVVVQQITPDVDWRMMAASCAMHDHTPQHVLGEHEMQLAQRKFLSKPGSKGFSVI